MTPEILRQKLVNLRSRFESSQEQQRETLTSDSGRFTARAPQNMAEQASDQQELDMMAKQLSASSERLSLIDEALGRLDAGHFNVCEECGGEIGERRLNIRPWSTVCVACQKKIEEGGT